MRQAWITLQLLELILLLNEENVVVVEDTQKHKVKTELEAGVRAALGSVLETGPILRIARMMTAGPVGLRIGTVAGVRAVAVVGIRAGAVVWVGPEAEVTDGAAVVVRVGAGAELADGAGCIRSPG